MSSEKANHYNNYAIMFQNINWDSTLHFAHLALSHATIYKQPEQAARAYNLIGKSLIYKGRLAMADSYIDSAQLLNKNLKNETSVEILINKGMIQEQHAIYAIALEYYQKALLIAEEIQSTTGKARALNSIGIINKELENYEKALESFLGALKIAENQNITSNRAFISNNIGTIYDLMGDTQNALNYYENALALNEKLGNTMAIAYTKHNIGIILKGLKQYRKANKYFQSSLKTANEQNDALAIAYNYHHIADMLLQQNKSQQALNYANKSLEIAKSQHLSTATFQNYRLISRIYQKMQIPGAALKNYMRYTELKDSVFNSQSQKRIEEIQNAYQRVHIEKRIVLLEKEQKQNQLELEKSNAKIRTRNTMLIILSSATILILLFGGVLLTQIKQKKAAINKLNIRNEEVNQQNEEIKVQRDNLSELNKKITAQKEEIQSQNEALAEQNKLTVAQRDKIYEQKQHLTDNITYASRIQKALIPPAHLFQSFFSDWFVFNRPQGIVGGDFYWLHETENGMILAVADSTGHGVTGGFMSILGISMLNDIVIRQGKTQTNEILNELRLQIVTLLHQDEKTATNKDGMDISIIRFDKTNQSYQFSGANHKAYIIDQKTNELSEIEGDRMPISIHQNMDETFNATTGSFTHSDVFYLFSDGFPDQFGGNTNRKYLYKNFKQLLIQNIAYPLNEQHDSLATEFYAWKAGLEQTDDVMIVAVKV
ncbi:MAG: tetratricopeptide repeat protein [Salinivirgaceae bacterium]